MVFLPVNFLAAIDKILYDIIIGLWADEAKEKKTRSHLMKYWLIPAIKCNKYW